MSMTSFSFILFFAFVYILLWIIKGIGRLRKRSVSFFSQSVLLLASYLFLAFSDWRFCFCLLFLTIFIFLFSMKISALKRVGKSGKVWFYISVFLSVFMLGIFKYFNFFAESLGKGFGVDYITLNLILPVGISFYTFSAISYIVDIYHGKYEACSCFGQFALYMGFFPKLVAGPIVRANEFLPQLKEERGVSIRNLEIGIQIFVLGMFKKVVLADHLGVFVDDVFATPAAFSTATCWLAVISYSLQIYFDFSGYSDLAIGIAKMCGYDLNRNFNLPYISKNLTEFWKRWHISLSSWLQEYLYYSLGGNRKGTVRTYINLFLTMLIGGLWHGANWTFVVWGAIHGIGLIVHKIWMKWKKMKFGSVTATTALWNIASVILTFLTVTIIWIFFRADSCSAALAVLKGLFCFRTGIHQMYTWSFFALFALGIATCVAVVKAKKENNSQIDGFYPILNLSHFWSLVLFFVFCGLTIGMGYYGNNVFIYGRF